MVKQSFWTRLWCHGWAGPWAMKRHFPETVFAQIENSIERNEKRHRGEIRVVVDRVLELSEIAKGLTPREKAIQVFSDFHIWDTEENNGVLIYLLFADRDVEIVADRGIASRIEPAEWENICAAMENCFRGGAYAEGLTLGVERVGDLLARHFPPREGDRNELPNAPVRL